MQQALRAGMHTDHRELVFGLPRLVSAQAGRPACSQRALPPPASRPRRGGAWSPRCCCRKGHSTLQAAEAPLNAQTARGPSQPRGNALPGKREVCCPSLPFLRKPSSITRTPPRTEANSSGEGTPPRPVSLKTFASFLTLGFPASIARMQNQHS